jgi:hydroxymethylbilane synthase
VTAERAFLRAMGGGCQSPVAAYAKVVRGNLHLRAISFRGAYALAADCIARPNEAQAIGTETAALLLNSP